ncbi:hypothetical protein QBC38DRAFT_6417 [Podospora fimiseda]|uniref:Uncharacterized protein n=1 Tax=Podospora fimiseda TaxID=252190 RepID=A0AAN7H988_9PEZI|nr:hypothetical protein QBC38DRAFT_6417 [Podospora fimiseda]
MTWGTYQTILKKGGGPHQTMMPGRPTYDFPVSLATPFLETLVDDWVGFFKVQLPQTEDPIMEKIMEIWIQYIKEVRDQVEGTAPDILPYFDSRKTSMAKLEFKMHDKARAAIREIYSNATKIHPLFVEVLREELAPIFEQALQITGKGQFQARQVYLWTEVGKKARKMFTAGCERMEKDYERRVNELPRDLEKIAKRAVKAVKLEIGLLLNNLQAAAAAGKEQTETLERKMKLQRSVKTLTLAWGAQWRNPEEDEAWGIIENLDIPEEFVQHAQPDKDDIKVKEERQSPEMDSSDSSESEIESIDMLEDTGSSWHEDEEMEDIRAGSLFWSHLFFRVFSVFFFVSHLLLYLSSDERMEDVSGVRSFFVAFFQSLFSDLSFISSSMTGKFRERRISSREEKLIFLGR